MFNPKYCSTRGSGAVNAHSQYYFVQPVMPAVFSCDERYSTSCCSLRSNQIFLTDQGFERCTCGNYQFYEENDYSSMKITASPKISSCCLQEVQKENRPAVVVGESTSNVICESNIDEPSKPEETSLKFLSTRSVSYEINDQEDYFKISKRRVSILVDELLLKIYGNSERKFSSAGTDTYFNGNSSDSSNINYKFNTFLRRKHSFTGISEDTCQKWFDVMKAKMMNKSLSELISLKDTLECNVAFVGSLLIKQLKRRDILFSRRDAQCGIITAFLQAISAKRSEDTKIQFSMKPSAGESGFQQWHGAMKMVARLPGGIPREFRKTLWLTLAERHIASKNINWSTVERTCFNDSTNPDDEELGIQIVKDLHRTGCSLFCGTSGEENQAVLKRVLLAYARWNKSVGYCQGFNMLAALILEVMDRCEYNSLKVMIYLIEGVLPESYFANSLRGFSIDMAVFRDLLRLKLPELSKHLEALQTGSNDAGNTYEPPLTNAFTMQWFLTLFCNCLPHSTVLRVWDLIFLEGNQVLLKTALAIWDTLSDRIMPVKSADEFYSIMCVLTREMLEFGLMDANCLIKTISSIELSELTELRDRYIYNITPWTQVARNGLRLFYSDDEMDDSDEEANDEKGSDLAYAFLKVATKHGSQSIRSISPSSILGPLANEKEKIALDILALKKQYCKIKERQRQAQIIFTASNTQEIVGSMMPSTPGPAINHLFLNKNAVSSSKVIKTQKPPVIPVSRAVQRLKENGILTGDESHNDRGETVYWDKRMKKRKRRRTQINVSKTASLDSFPQEPDNFYIHSDSSDSSPTSSFKSSSSTELCDEMAEVDSEDANTSMSEYGTSPHYRLRSSNLSLVDDDKSESEQTHSKPADLGLSADNTSEYRSTSSDSTNYNISSLYHPDDEENILNVLLTSSIMANEQLNKEKCSIDAADIQPSLAETNGELDAISDTCDNDNDNDNDDDDSRPKEFEFVSQKTPQSSITADKCRVGRHKARSTTGKGSAAQSPSDDVETALEHMKIDALAILLSSQTLESIRRESQTEITYCKRKSADCDTKYENENSCQTTEPCDGAGVPPFHLNRETEMALQRILSENTEVLKKVNQSYYCTSFESKSKDNVCGDNQLHSRSNVTVAFPRLNVTDCSDRAFDGDGSSQIAGEEQVYDYPQHSAYDKSLSSRFSAREHDDDGDISVQGCHCGNSSFAHDHQLVDLDESAELVLGSDGSSERTADAYDKCESTDAAGECYNKVTACREPHCQSTRRSSRSRSSSSSSSVQRDALGSVNNERNSRCQIVVPADDRRIKCHTDDENDAANEYLKRKKYKSLDNLHFLPTTSKLEIGLVGRAGKWISISIDNSDLVVLNSGMPCDGRLKSAKLNCDPENGAVSSRSGAPNTETKTDDLNERFDVKSTDTSRSVDLGHGHTDPYLHLNFDIIAPGKKKRDPIEQYVHKKNFLSQNFRAPELTAINFNPFPSKPNNRPPKEVGVKLGLYSACKK